MRKKLSVFIPMSIMVLMLAACGSSNNSTPSSSDVPNVKEETSTTGQIENEKIEKSNGEDSSVDSSVDSTSTLEPTPTETPTSTPEPTPTETPSPTPTETPSPTPTETPSPTPTETPSPTPTETPSPTPTETPSPTPTETPSPTPTETPTPTPTPEPTVPSEEEDKEKEPNGSAWSGNYDSLVTEGFDHIKVPTIDDFYDEGLSNNDGAFDFGNRPEWEDAWYDAYDEFLVANGSPIDPDTGKPMGAFNAIHDGFIQGYQYLYYGFSQGATNGWGDIVLLPVGLNSSMANNPNYDGAYVLELTNFTFGNMDKGLEDEYRAAITMMLSWIVPNPSQVEKAIYDTFIEDHCILYDHTMANGCGSWLQIGDIDITVVKISLSSETYMFAFREHR